MKVLATGEIDSVNNVKLIPCIMLYPNYENVISVTTGLDNNLIMTNENNKVFWKLEVEECHSILAFVTSNLVGQDEKVVKTMKWEERINIGKYVYASDEKPYVYEYVLVGYVKHFGCESDVGHYKAYVCLDSGEINNDNLELSSEWYEFDDSKVSKVVNDIFDSERCLNIDSMNETIGVLIYCRTDKVKSLGV